MNTTLGLKRVLITTLLGLAVGAICAYASFSGGFMKFTPTNLIWVLLNRGVMGFCIGISGLGLRWMWNGIVVGAIVGSIFSYFLFMHLGPGVPPPANAAANGVFGFLIELLTTKVFKQPGPFAHRDRAQAVPA